MQGSSQAAAREDAALTFKRFILERSSAFESEPQADLYRVNLLAQMLDRYDELRAAGVASEPCAQRVCKEFANIPQRMQEAGFERDMFKGAGRADSRWPQLTDEEVDEFLKQESSYVHRNGIGAALCAACCAPLFVGTAFGELAWRYSDAPTMMGLIGMFAMIGLGVYVFVTAEKPKLHNDVKRGRFSLSNRLRRKLEAMRGQVNGKARKKTALGIAMFVTCLIPLFAGVVLMELFYGYDFFPLMGLAGMFGMIGLGVHEVVQAEGEKKAIKRLLREGGRR